MGIHRFFLVFFYFPLNVFSVRALSYEENGTAGPSPFADPTTSAYLSHYSTQDSHEPLECYFELAFSPTHSTRPERYSKVRVIAE